MHREILQPFQWLRILFQFTFYKNIPICTYLHIWDGRNLRWNNSVQGIWIHFQFEWKPNWLNVPIPLACKKLNHGCVHVLLSLNTAKCAVFSGPLSYCSFYQSPCFQKSKCTSLRSHSSLKLANSMAKECTSFQSLTITPPTPLPPKWLHPSF